MREVWGSISRSVKSHVVLQSRGDGPRFSLQALAQYRDYNEDQVVLIVKALILGCFIFSPFLKSKMLGSAYDGILATDFKYVIFFPL